MMSQQSYMVMKEFLKSQLKKYNSICKRYDDQDTKYVFNISFPKCSIESFKRRYREDYDESIYLPFETLILRCPKGYERCLDIMYTHRNHISWKKPVKNLALHSQELEKIVDVDHPYTDYVKMFYDRPEDLIKI